MSEFDWSIFFTFFLLTALPGIILLIVYLPGIIQDYFHERQIIKSLRPKKYGNDVDFDFTIARGAVNGKK